MQRIRDDILQHLHATESRLTQQLSEQEAAMESLRDEFASATGGQRRKRQPSSVTAANANWRSRVSSEASISIENGSSGGRGPSPTSMRASTSNGASPSDRVWGLVEGDREIKTMLKDVRKQIKDFADRSDRYAYRSGPADPNAEGTLHIKLLRGVGLKAADSNGFSDPYCKLSLGGVTHKSKTIKKTLNPEWHEEFEYDGKLGQLLSERLYLQVYDYDLASRDDLIGQGELDLSTQVLLDNVSRDLRCDLIEGSLQLQMRWVPELYAGGSPGKSPMSRSTSRGNLLSRAPSSLLRPLSPKGGSRIRKHRKRQTGLCTYLCGPVLHPDSRFRSAWNVLLAVFIIYCGVAVPLEIGARRRRPVMGGN